jgi:hypothetical protein
LRIFSGSLTRLLRYAISLDARRTTVRLCSIKAASLAMRAKFLAKNKKIGIEEKRKENSALKRNRYSIKILTRISRIHTDIIFSAKDFTQ